MYDNGLYHSYLSYRVDAFIADAYPLICVAQSKIWLQPYKLPQLILRANIIGKPLKIAWKRKVYQIIQPLAARIQETS